MLDTVPPVRKVVAELVRVEFIDRSMVVAAQGLLALVPLVVVLAAFLPQEVTALGIDRFESVTGVGEASADLVTDQVAGTAAGLDASAVRTQTGLLGLALTLLSASSFARAVQRMYERVWGRSHVGGFRGRRLCLGWLLGWLLAMQGLSVVGWLDDRVGGVALDPFWLVLRAALATVLWWWTLHLLLFGRVPWRPLLVPALVTGAAVVAYAAGSTVVMPRYATSSAQQFGTFGLVLAVATWLVGFAGVLVVSAVVGRVLVEDAWVRRTFRWVG
ncbi:hypothetical protein [Nocardioides lianchengensis]|uniref:Membrane protein n=1 Tax=Nocardioides lianchengensis TaxID=1045774 RepID=A0A1G6W3J4_9ACTN|nr:hypothetical protein [Nocardioides lianchengensis]NYG09452.1 membrane protein [Nocardioides lianchengensis]SDD60358.1 membrane protein [Nocardioides lianchengensis]